MATIPKSVADAVLALRQPTKKRAKAEAEKSGHSSCRRFFDDAIPF